MAARVRNVLMMASLAALAACSGSDDPEIDPGADAASDVPDTDAGDSGDAQPEVADGADAADAQPDTAPDVDDTSDTQEPLCGNGIPEGREQCDDGNDIDDDLCTNACTTPICGDLIVQAGEGCDDGNTINNDACSNACVPATCGDGLPQAPEACDDGNDVDDDLCTNACTAPACGDGIVQASEECEPVSTDAKPVDTCDPDCTFVVCGDGVQAPSEGCDDSNNDPGDGCDAFCVPEPPLRVKVTLHGEPVGNVSVTVFLPDETSTTLVSDPTTGDVYFTELVADAVDVVIGDATGVVLFDGSGAPIEGTVDLSGGPTYVQAELTQSRYPGAADAYEPDNSVPTDRRIVVDGALLLGTIYPVGDSDFVGVELEAGVEYEIFTTFLDFSGDTLIKVYPEDATTELAVNDDYVDRDSRLRFTPDTSGLYWVRVLASDVVCAQASYAVGVRRWVDADGDTFGTFHDCATLDASVSPIALEIGGDAIDQDCDLSDAPDPSGAWGTPSPTGAEALPVEFAFFNPAERLYSAPVIDRAWGTITSSAEVDWWTVVLDPHEVVTLYAPNPIGGTADIAVTDNPAGLPIIQFSGFVRYPLRNTTAAPRQYWFKVSATAPTSYRMYVIPNGLDADGDGVASAVEPRDLDDSSASIQSCGGGI